MSKDEQIQQLREQLARAEGENAVLREQLTAAQRVSPYQYIQVTIPQPAPQWQPFPSPTPWLPNVWCETGGSGGSWGLGNLPAGKV